MFLERYDNIDVIFQEIN